MGGTILELPSDKLRFERAEGRREGRAEGRVEGRVEGERFTLYRLIRDGLISIEVGAQQLGKSVQFVKEDMKRWEAETAKAGT